MRRFKKNGTLNNMSSQRQSLTEPGTKDERSDDGMEEGIEMPSPSEPTPENSKEKKDTISKIMNVVSSKIASGSPGISNKGFEPFSDAASSEGESVALDAEGQGADLGPRLPERDSLLRGTRPEQPNEGGVRIVFRRPRLKSKRFWASCCSVFCVMSFISWFIILIPIARYIIGVKTLSATSEILSATLEIEETADVIKIKSLRAHVPQSAWDMGFPLNMFSFEAHVPPMKAKLFVHLGKDDKIIEGGDFTAHEEVTLRSWEDLDVTVSGLMRPLLSSMTELFEEVMGAPEMRVHIEMVTDIGVTMMGWFPVKIPSVSMVTGIQKVPAMNGFKDNPITVTSIDRIVTSKNGLEATLTAEIKNPTPFSMKVGFPLTLDGSFNGTRLGGIKMQGMVIPPYGEKARMETDYVFVKDSEDTDRAFHQAIQAFLDHPHELSPAGKTPFEVGALAPKTGKASSNPIINAAMSGNFHVSALLKLPTVKMIRKLEVALPVVSIWQGPTANIEMDNPSPATIYIDGVHQDLYYKNISGVHLYTMNQTWESEDLERPHLSPGIGNISLSAGMSGVDPGSAQIIQDIISRFVHGDLHNMTVGCRGYFNLSIGNEFQTQIQYENDAITSKLVYAFR